MGCMSLAKSIPLRVACLVLSIVCAAPVIAQEPTAQEQADEQAQEEPAAYEEQVVVTASRAQQELVNAPAAISVITSETIENSPAANIGDLLRTVPGLNVTQVSARDINMTARGATSTLATSQLALVDGRSVYLDFFGMVMWDLVPNNANNIRQIEVVRGPASAVWGANAMNGVVNVITKSPREIAAEAGTTFTIRAGAFDRPKADSDAGRGPLFSVDGSFARAIDDRWAYRVSAGYLTQDAFSRPTGVIGNAFQTPYPSYMNTGTSQPKFEARVDYDMPGGGTVAVTGGVAGTEGIIHSGIGPFDIASDSRMTHLTARYQKGGRRIAMFTNLLDGSASNLLARDPAGQPLPLVFDTKTFDVEASDVRVVGTNHLVTFGGNIRRNTFAISLAPAGADRTEGGGFVQDEMFFGEHVRWVVGGRLDKFSSIDNAVFSPRTTLMLKPNAAQTFRVSFNRAFRAPSYINNHIDTTILNEIDLSALSPALAGFVFPIHTVGNPDLRQEAMTAYEVGYTGAIANRATVTASAYWNVTTDGMYFTPNAFYSPGAPPPGLPPQLVGVLAGLTPPVLLPSQFIYLNLGTITDKGIELGVDAAVNPYLNVFTNYSFQAKPVATDLPLGTSIDDINWPAKNRFNAGFDFSRSRFLGNMALSYTGEAYWQDVLDARYAATTDAHTLVSGAFGIRWADRRVVTSVKVTNLLNEDVLQHVFGDVLKRQVVGEARVTF
jgi:outer membrane receptor protein involved in Fe transport